jgi:hypothetical protein
MSFYKYKDSPTVYGPGNAAFSNPDQAFAAGVAKDWSNVQTLDQPMPNLLATPQAPPQETQMQPQASPQPLQAPPQAQKPVMPQFTPTPYTPPQIDTSRLSSLEQQFQQNLGLSPEEQQAQTEYQNFQNSFQQGQQGIRDKVIPMQFITGQLESQARTAALQEIPLQQKLAMAQAKRQAALEASKFALSREDERVRQMKDDARYGFEQNQQNAKMMYENSLNQFEYEQSQSQNQLQMQDAARQNAIENGISSPFYEVAGTVYRTSDNKAYSSPEEAARDGVDTKSWSNVQKVKQEQGVDLKQYPASYQEYLLAKQDGFSGSYNDYQTMDANRKRSISNSNTTIYQGDQEAAKRETRVKQIIDSNPGEWGQAAAQIDREFGAGTATKYDALLKKAYLEDDDLSYPF